MFTFKLKGTHSLPVVFPPFAVEIMKKFMFILLAVILLAGFTFAQSGEVNIIPKPRYIKSSAGQFKLDQETKIVATDKIGRKTAGILNDLIHSAYGFKLEFTDKPLTKNAIIFIPPISPQHGGDSAIAPMQCVSLRL